MIYLTIEFIDELGFGIGETAWPLIRSGLRLTYAQIGLLISPPGITAAFIEPFLGVLGGRLETPPADPRRRIFLHIFTCPDRRQRQFFSLAGFVHHFLPGQSASIMAIESVTTPLAKLLPLLIGLLADKFGLGIAIWLLLLGPLALMIGLPRQKPASRA